MRGLKVVFRAGLEGEEGDEDHEDRVTEGGKNFESAVSVRVAIVCGLCVQVLGPHLDTSTEAVEEHLETDAQQGCALIVDGEDEGEKGKQETDCLVDPESTLFLVHPNRSEVRPKVLILAVRVRRKAELCVGAKRRSSRDKDWLLFAVEGLCRIDERT